MALADTETELPDGVVAIDGDVVTTQEEVDAFLIVKAIVSEVLPADRVFMRDGKTYCSVIADDNNRRPICRFWFNARSKRYIGLFDTDKKETKVELENSLDEIYGFKSQLREAAAAWV